MVRSISIKSGELFELLNGNAKSGGDNTSFMKEVIEIAKERAIASVGNNYDVAIAAAEKDVQSKLAELQERSAVIAKMKNDKAKKKA